MNIQRELPNYSHMRLPSDIEAAAATIFLASPRGLDPDSRAVQLTSDIDGTFTGEISWYWDASGIPGTVTMDVSLSWNGTGWRFETMNSDGFRQWTTEARPILTHGQTKIRTLIDQAVARGQSVLGFQA